VEGIEDLAAQAEGVVVRSISSNWSVKSISLNYAK
jgi:hypothetical protein